MAWLSQTPNWDGVHGIWLGGHQGQQTTPLLVGASYSYQKTITLPQNICGTWYIIAVPDTHYITGATDVGASTIPRDQGSAQFQIQLPPALDLQVTSVAAPTSGQAGQPMSVTWTVSNEGFGPTASSSWTDAVYLSADATLETSGSGADTLLGTFTHTGNLAPVESYTQTESVQLPYGISGPYYVFVVTDSGNNVFEHADSYDAEANNSLDDPTPVQITLPPPADLLVTSITASPAASGQPMTVSWTVANQGLGSTSAGPWSDQLVLSADNDLTTTADNTTLGTFVHTGSLAPDGYYTDTETVTLPVGISGTYHLFVTIDVNNNVPEGSGETNNSSSIDLPVALTPPPDLQVTSILVPDGPWSGQPMSVQWTVTNTGQGPTRPNETAWTDRVYLSDNGVLDTSADTLLGSFPHNGGLAASASYTQSQSLTLPIGISGPYTLFIVTDATNSVFEGPGQSNNVSSQPLTVNLTPPPDLQVGNISTPASAYAGQPITINWMVTNIGTGPTVPGAWNDSVYLSRDQFLDPTADLYLGSVHHVGTLVAGASYSASFSATVPAYASGPYYVFVLSDSGGAVFEDTAKANNTAFDPTATVVTFAPPADLVVANITVPPSGVAGQAPSPSITWTVTNQGTNPAVGSWYDSVYLSANGTWSVTDPLIDRVQHTGDLAPGASYTASTTAPLPAVVPGNYHVIVRTDILNNVRETDKTNNLLASASTIAMDVPELPLDVATPATIDNNQDLYYRIDTTAGQDVLITSSFNQPGQAEFYVRYGAHRPVGSSTRSIRISTTSTNRSRFRIPRQERITSCFMAARVLGPAHRSASPPK